MSVRMFHARRFRVLGDDAMFEYDETMLPGQARIDRLNDTDQFGVIPVFEQCASMIASDD